ncbi:MAG: formimidoylglutamate deiminase [Acidobacteria bacterium]|nr:MAG: formimidoylglutamate deiminase [Acidobacteriota bacterium]REJ98883.1 MAG: formimidoylglutamate deiminase [Acidobacteriota bacterium]REK16397.1 MAG: formimidoylglutamate deiminase [Acidobacteriota bacterium]REK44078.1 MAG: formimidoylglutamate deiminase [Acidobacteriota bacterium]
MDFHFKAILQSDGWVENARISTDDKGVITSIESGEDSNAASGYVIPGFRNCHSHAFQYAMAGLAERHDRDSGRDDFWGWRNTMYELALSLDPDQVEQIATMLYKELVRHGYTHVCEFHYLHHDKDGSPYGNLAEMGERLIAAAEAARINLTLLPVFYQKGGFGKDPLPEQRRFISRTLIDYASLLQHTIEACKHSEYASAGIAVHSLRGVDPEDVVRTAEDLGAELPFHIHISEQVKEVDECIEHLGLRPVEWFLRKIAVSDRFNLVHATHITDREARGIVKSGASVVLCPSTEGNLGDGIFPLKEFQDAGGRWSIGTDSHIGLSPFEELRLLDYGQRLISHRRDTFTGSSESSGENAIRSAFFAGVNATGEETSEYFEVGKPLNACVIRDDVPLIENCELEALGDRIVYASDATWIKGTVVNGRALWAG